MLENKLGLSARVELAEAEERISKKKAVRLFESGRLDAMPAGTFASLQEIHRCLFEDIYDFAGTLREVNLAKGNFRFAPVLYLNAALEIKHLLREALTDQTEDRTIFMKGIDRSYDYEGYAAFQAEKL